MLGGFYLPSPLLAKEGKIRLLLVWMPYVYRLV